MNTPRILSFVLLMALLLVIAASASASAPRDPKGLGNPSGLAVDLSWTVFSAGGGHAASATYSLDATLGQPFVGPSSGPAVTLAAGFWQDQAGYRVYLPIVIK